MTPTRVLLERRLTRFVECASCLWFGARSSTPADARYCHCGGGAPGPRGAHLLVFRRLERRRPAASLHLPISRIPRRNVVQTFTGRRAVARIVGLRTRSFLREARPIRAQVVAKETANHSRLSQRRAAGAETRDGWRTDGRSVASALWPRRDDHDWGDKGQNGGKDPFGSEACEGRSTRLQPSAFRHLRGTSPRRSEGPPHLMEAERRRHRAHRSGTFDLQARPVMRRGPRASLPPTPRASGA